MTRYEYKVVPAPDKGGKPRGVKAPEARFALAIEEVLNRMAAEGWEYVRAELLPSTERKGLRAASTVWRNLLVFRRRDPSAAASGEDEAGEAPRLLSAPGAGQPPRLGGASRAASSETAPLVARVRTAGAGEVLAGLAPGAPRSADADPVAESDETDRTDDTGGSRG